MNNRYVVPQKRLGVQELEVKPLLTTTNGKKLKLSAMVDSGCTHTCIDEELVKKKKIPTKKLERPITCRNSDGMIAGKKDITKFVKMDLNINGHNEQLDAVVTPLQSSDLFLGHDWLTNHNPEIDWKQGIIKFNRCPTSCSFPHTDISFEPRIRRLQSNEDTEEKEPDPTNPEDLPAYMKPFAHLFNKKNFDKLPERTEWDHEINFTENAPTEISSKVYSMTPLEREELDKFLDENLATNRIRPSKSPYAAPCFFVPKKDGSLRLCQDYRKLNDITIKDKTPLPLISEVLDQLKDAKVFNKLDIIWGYNNVRIREGDEWKAAFLTNRGLFEPTVMFFGMSNSPATFSRMMATIFREMIQEGSLANYMDDFIIPAKDDEELEARTIRFLKISEKHNLSFKRTKCEFNVSSTTVLGTVIGNGKATMEEEKVKAIRDWAVPTTVKQVESFLGFANFYRRFIKNFSTIAQPLNELKSKKGEKWYWNDEQQQAFEQIKQAIASEPVLALPKDKGQFRVEVDASNYGTGAVLSQEQENKWHPVAFMSKTLSEAERNYEIYDKELLAIIKALKLWRHYLLDAKEQFEIWTDHENLKYFREPQKLNARQARWYLMLQEYDFLLRHIPGKTNTKADILSRLIKPDTSNDNRGVEMFKEKMFIRRLEESTPIHDVTLLHNRRFEILADETVLEKIRKCERRETRVLEEMKKQPEKVWENKGIIYRQGRIYVPDNQEIRDFILHDHHNSPDARHPGTYRMLESVKRTFWWPTIKTDIRRYVRGCDMCQKNKTIRRPDHIPLNPLPIPDKPWEEISIDMIGPLPKSKEKDAIIVIVDRFSKMIHLVPTTTSLTSMDLAEIYKEEIWRHHGIPKRIISDRGPQFASKFMESLCKALGIERNLSTAYHPQTDGQTERMNQEIETYLRAFINYRQDDWTRWLPMAEFHYNDKTHAATGQTPFFLNYGLHPWKGNITVETTNPSATSLIGELEDVREEAKAAMETNNEMMRERGNNKHHKEPFAEGDKVWLETTNIHSNRPTRKLDHKRYGPFEILKQIGDRSYKLKLPDTWAIHNVFHTSLLTKVRDPEFDSQKKPTPPPPDIINEEEEYEVEEIRGHRRRGRGIQFLVHWKGYGNEDDSWIPQSSLENAEEALSEYRAKLPNGKL
ncbi:hypothetical protein Agabi119p4_1345 [Agaricus bisporus var. burnettii]|uniref:RNA-directed DNA polymerase n=1 Tax=Agaricus bisporus var. burnettii TaxID=192524 RepID=A0A8H7FDA1_AGABI|nr:hypothetical protein Agabi119p4_1345 [Agaricus bisporus var. burnettii]